MGRQKSKLESGVRDEIVAEHNHLEGLVRDLELTADPARLPLLLDGLHTLLERHFAREESPDGLYDLLQVKTGSTSTKAEVLRGEHPELLAHVAHLVELSRRTQDCSPLRPAISDCCARLRMHERRESLLMIDALSRGTSA